MKFINQKEKSYLPMNLQLFAENGDSSDNAGDGDDDQDDADQDDKGTDGKDKKSDKAKGKMETQEEINEMISDRLKRERRKDDKKKEQTKEDKQSTKGSDDKSKATDDKVSALESKLLCFEHDVSKDSVSDVVALAKAYVDEDTDFEEAIKKVIKKYPQFIKGTSKKGSDDEDEDSDETDNKGSWGTRQKGQSKKSNGVEDAFLKRNPGLKID